MPWLQQCSGWSHSPSLSNCLFTAAYGYKGRIFISRLKSWPVQIPSGLEEAGGKREPPLWDRMSDNSRSLFPIFLHQHYLTVSCYFVSFEMGLIYRWREKAFQVLCPSILGAVTRNHFWWLLHSSPSSYVSPETGRLWCCRGYSFLHLQDETGGSRNWAFCCPPPKTIETLTTWTWSFQYLDFVSYPVLRE